MDAKVAEVIMGNQRRLSYGRVRTTKSSTFTMIVEKFTFLRGLLEMVTFAKV